jgi:hypothetical protein
MRFVTALIALCPFLLGISGDNATAQRAEQFMLLVKAHRFEEAAKAFYYPPQFTPLRLEREHAMIEQFLASVFRVAGDIKSQKGMPQGYTNWWNVGVGAGPPVSPQDIGAESSTIVAYLLQSTQEGRASVNLYFVRVHGKWLILRFDFCIPRTADNAGHFDEFSRKVFSGCRACQPTKDKET